MIAAITPLFAAVTLTSAEKGGFTRTIFVGMVMMRAVLT
jgi:hypothetical protein